MAFALQSLWDFPPQTRTFSRRKLFIQDLKEGLTLFFAQVGFKDEDLIPKVAVGRGSGYSIQGDEDAQRLAHSALVLRCRYKSPERDPINHLLSFAVMGPDARPVFLSSKTFLVKATAFSACTGLAAHSPAAVNIICNPVEILVALD